MSTSTTNTTIIIGGGLAGLTIAEFLANKKSGKVILVEQYKMYGGRVNTYREPAKGIQYEIGAGRIFHTHHLVHGLIKRFGLHTFPISSTQSFDEKTNLFHPLFEPIRQVLQLIPREELEKHTIEELVPQSLQSVFQYYPYWSEIHLLRADLALPLFSSTNTMGTSSSHAYVGIKEGMDSLTSNLHDAAEKAGAVLKNRHKVTDIKRVSSSLFEITGLKGKKAEAKPFKYEANRVIIATCRCGYSNFDILKPHLLMKQLATSPLTRIYAIYDPPLPITEKIVTDSPLRYIIPINPKNGLIMISYTDGDDTHHWNNKDGDELADGINEELRKLFPEINITKPTFIKKHEWPNGCTYWLPGDYDPREASKVAHNPEPNLYLTGESVSTNQTWMEGALESAEYLKTLLVD